MISKKEILTMVREVFKRSHGYKIRKVTHPHREWFIAIGLFVVVVLVGAFLNYKQHIYYTNVETTIDVTTPSTKEYKDKTAQLALSIYDARLENFNDLAGTVPVDIFPVEPSATSSEAVASSTQEVIVEEIETEDENGLEDDPVVPVSE